jgi:hypothetical protein
MSARRIVNLTEDFCGIPHTLQAKVPFHILSTSLFSNHSTVLTHKTKNMGRILCILWMAVIKLTQKSDLSACFICHASETILVEVRTAGINQTLHCELHIGLFL